MNTQTLPDEVRVFASTTQLAGIEFLGAGFTSEAYKAGNNVLKLSKVSRSYEDAELRAATYQTEHELIEEYLGELVVPTVFGIVPTAVTGQARVLQLQPFIEGSALLNIDQDGREKHGDLLRSFFRRSLNMHELTGYIPDTAHPQQGYLPFRTPNIIIEENSFRPMLVDTTLGSFQRRAWSRRTVTALIARSNRRAMDSL